jgi:hypothetical protein
VKDRDALGIPPDAPVWSGNNELPEGWTLDWIGVRLFNPPPRPWDWPYVTLRGGRNVWMTVQLWRRTVTRPGFAYSVLWHPDDGRTYIAEGVEPEDLPRLVREAQRVLRRETRGRPRKRPPPDRFIADRSRIRHANGGREPSPGRMAEEYGVRKSTVER